MTTIDQWLIAIKGCLQAHLGVRWDDLVYAESANVIFEMYIIGEGLTIQLATQIFLEEVYPS